MLTNSHHLNHPPNRSPPIANKLLTWWSANPVDRCDERLLRRFDLRGGSFSVAQSPLTSLHHAGLTDSSVRFWHAMCFAFECACKWNIAPMEANHSELHTFSGFAQLFVVDFFPLIISLKLLYHSFCFFCILVCFCFNFYNLFKIAENVYKIAKYKIALFQKSVKICWIFFQYKPNDPEQILNDQYQFSSNYSKKHKPIIPSTLAQGRLA